MSASAFDAATRGAHWAAFADNAGTIRAGALASLAVWDIDNTELDAARAVAAAGW